MNQVSERVVDDLTKRTATIYARKIDELGTFRARLIQLETRSRLTTQSASTLPQGPVVVESMHTNTVHDQRRSPLPAGPFNEHVLTPQIPANRFTYDVLPHVQKKSNRGTQYVPATFRHGFPIDDPTNVPGIEAERTLLSPFKEVISYETNRLKYERSKLYASEGCEIHRQKKRIGGLLHTLREFDGNKPIAILTSLSQLRERLNALGVSEAAAVRVIAFVLAGDAKSFYDSVRMGGSRSRTVTKTYTWPHVVHALIDRYLTDTELQNAYDRVTLIAQRTNETENEYSDSIFEAARDFANVFEDIALLHYCDRGLLETTRLDQMLKHFP